MAAKQLRIAGTQRDKSTIHKSIEDAAAHYVDIRDKRMDLSKKEKEAKESLTAEMKKAKLEEYVCDEIDQKVTFETEAVTTVKVKKIELNEEPDAPEAD